MLLLEGKTRQSRSRGRRKDMIDTKRKTSTQMKGFMGCTEKRESGGVPKEYENVHWKGRDPLKRKHPLTSHSVQKGICNRHSKERIHGAWSEDWWRRCSGINEQTGHAAAADPLIANMQLLSCHNFLWNIHSKERDPLSIPKASLNKWADWSRSSTSSCCKHQTCNCCHNFNLSAFAWHYIVYMQMWKSFKEKFFRNFPIEARPLKALWLRPYDSVSPPKAWCS